MKETQFNYSKLALNQVEPQDYEENQDELEQRKTNRRKTTNREEEMNSIYTGATMSVAGRSYRSDTMIVFERK